MIQEYHNEQLLHICYNFITSMLTEGYRLHVFKNYELQFLIKWATRDWVYLRMEGRVH
jgi:hypothetical protein